MALIVWNIVKWILWILLFLLLFFAGIVCLVLFVPVRYRIQGRVEEKAPDVEAKITWLLHMISLRLEWKTGIRLRIRIFGIPVFDSDRPAREKKRSGKNKTTFRKKKTTSGKEESEPEHLPEIVIHSETAQEDTSATRESIAAESPSEESTAAKSKAWEETPPKKTLWEKILALKDKLTKIRRRGADIKATIDRFVKIWKREETQAAFALCKDTLGKVIKAILPKAWSLTGVVGFEDPSATGYMMAGLGIGHPFFGNHIMITPDFEHSILQLAGKAKGKISIFTLVWQALRIITNRNCRKFLKLISAAVSGQEQEVEKHGRK